tara:strand:+ start:737 stop:2476 length:1740 start_codon:yes stop_codon:yes gene_type:complete
MGVPGFFLWLWKKYKKTNFVFSKGKIDDEDLNNKINSLDYLLIDANCLIHPTCFKVLADNPDFKDQDNLENKMMNAVLDYIDKLINYVDPKKGIYLAIDGVAPTAKIKQQRYRRFKSYHDKVMFDNIKVKHNKVVNKNWNNSAITPGTEFMEKLHYKILEWCKKSKRKIIYSSCKTPSEGEHKLLQFIRDNIKEKLEHSYVMYGLDADLIFLCLSTKSPNMFLLREATEFDKKSHKEDLNYVSIDIMKELIIDSMEEIATTDDTKGDIIDKKNYNNVISDFIFICYLLGNDFLPHMPALDIYGNGLDIILEKYIELIGNYGYDKFIVESNKKPSNINMKLFTEFISYLASEESETLKNIYASSKKHYKCNSTDPYDIELHRIDNIYFKVDDPILLGSDESELWKKRYYNFHFNLNEDEYSNYVEKLVKEYIIGLKWVTNYYFDGCPSWDWYYPFNYPPFLEDIRDFLVKEKSFNVNKHKFNYGSPLKPFNQLLLVLPPQSSYLIPKELRKIVHNPNSSLAYLYPTQIKQDFIGKHKYWMAQPLLPSFDINHVRRIYRKYEDGIPNDVLNRNKKLKIFTF